MTTLTNQFFRRHLQSPLLWLLLAVAIANASRAANNQEPLVVVQNGKYGFIDHRGKIVIPPKYMWADYFWRGLGTVYVCGRYVSIDSSGKLWPLRIAVAGQLVPRKSGNKFGFVDSSGQFQIPPAYEDALPFSEGFAAVQVEEKWGFINARGEEVMHPQFDGAFYFHEGIAVANLGPDWMLIDRAGKIVAHGFDFSDLVSDGRIPARRTNKWGYLDLHGNEVIPFIYDHVSPFYGGLAAVENAGEWGYLDREGRLVIPLVFDEAGPFADGLAPAKTGNVSGFIDRTGKFKFHLEFSYAPGFLTGDEESNLLIAESDVSRFWTKDGKFGYVNLSGKVIWGPNNDSPDHPPLLGWSEEQKAKSCDEVPEPVRSRIAGFPER